MNTLSSTLIIMLVLCLLPAGDSSANFLNEPRDITERERDAETQRERETKRRDEKHKIAFILYS